jgi:uncharacterized membrane protein YraQ (UPF0718 family)
MWKEKLGNYLLDISKYLLTGVVISSFFRNFGDNEFFIYGFGITASVLMLLVGLVLLNKKENK